MKDSPRDLIWVDKEFAEKYKKMESDKVKDEERLTVLTEYMKKLSEESRSDFKASLESIEEDAVIYTGLMLKVKQAFGKAKDEALDASYALWDGYQKELPSVKKKVNEIVSTLDPLKSKLEEINNLLSKIKTYDIDRFIETLNSLARSYGKSKEMIEFLVQNFKAKEA
jgi:chromosome segregation ATPase